MKLKIPCPIGFLWYAGFIILFIEGPDQVLLEILNWREVKGKKSEEVIEIILCEYPIINSLESSI
jgi:hypothetical protein